MSQVVLRVDDVTKTYRVGPTTVTALGGVSLAVAEGEFVVVQGRSGSGKTTLLNVVGGLERPDTGSVLLAGTDVWRADEDARARLRRTELAFVFQAFGLLPLLSAAENVEVPLRLAGVAAADRAGRTIELLAEVGLTGRSHHRPGELSGGEQQRVAIARALAVRPRLIIADEPTGQLDSTTGGAIIQLLGDTARTHGMSLLVATHDPAIAAVADRVLRMSDGHLTAP
jgi:putative ABC transport system ATP-binding protein